MNGSIDVLLDHFLGDHDGIFEVISIPRHERDEHIAPQCELALIGVWTISDDLTAFHMLTFVHNRLLVHARAGI